MHLCSCRFILWIVPQGRGQFLVAKDPVHRGCGTKIIHVLPPDLIGGAEKKLLFGVLHHDPTKLGFFHGGIRQLARLRDSPTGEEKDIRIEIPHEILRMGTYERNGVFQKQSAGGQRADLQFRQF